MSNAEWGAIPKQLAEDVSSTLMRKFNVQTGFKPVEWNNNIKALTPLPEKTISGMSTFLRIDDGADDAPIKSIVINVSTNISSFKIYHVVGSTTNQYTVSLGKTVSGGYFDAIAGVGIDENGDEYTFTPISVNTILGINMFMGNPVSTMTIVYRSSDSGSSTLISKNITSNGIYSASDDNADGYSDVTVDVQPNFETVLSSNPLVELTGVNGTDVSRNIWTYTATDNCKIKFHSNTRVRTNTGDNEGYFTVKKNDTVIVSTYVNTSTTTQFPIPDIELESGDTVTIIGGFDGYHTSCWFDIYSTITILHVDN